MDGVDWKFLNPNPTVLQSRDPLCQFNTEPTLYLKKSLSFSLI